MKKIGILRKLRPSEWVASHLWIEGGPFSFKDRGHLPYLYDIDSQFTVLKTGRGCEKSTYLGNNIVFHSSTVPGHRTLYVSTSPQQLTDFVVQQLSPRLKSPWIRDHLFDSTCTDNIHVKDLRNQSIIFLRPVFESPDRCRGIRAELLCIDEIQDQMYRNVPVLEQVLFSSKKIKKRKLYSGTPKTFDNLLEYYWSHSNQTMLHFPCSCGYLDNVLDSPKYIGLKGPICIKCGRLINTELGFWVSHKPKEFINGFYWNQLSLKWSYADPAAWQSLLFNLETYPAAKFANEVLGISQDNADKPITEAELRACADGTFYEHPEDFHYYKPMMAGIDWGTGSQSKSVIVLTYYDNGKWVVPFFKEFPTHTYPTQESVVEAMAEIINEWRVKRVASDWGFGVANNERLVTLIDAETLFEFYNSATLKTDAKWSSLEGKYTINYVTTMTQMFQKIKDRKFSFPSGPEADKFFSHFLNVHIEYREQTRRMLYANSPERPDDFCHALNYAHVISSIFHGMLNPLLSS